MRLTGSPLAGAAARGPTGPARPARALALVLAALAACASPHPAALARPRTGDAALPAGDGAALLLGRTSVALVRGDEELWRRAHDDAGDPRASCVDLDSAWACVAYGARLAFVQLATGSIAWVESPAGAAPDGVALRGETAVLWSGERATAVRVPGGARLWEEDLAPLLASSGVRRLDHVVPRGDAGAVVLASRGGTSFTDGRVVVLRIDRSRGDWRIEAQSELAGLTWVHRAASEGASLFVAGIREETQLSAGGPGRLWQALVVLRVDLETLAAEEVLWSQRQTRSTAVLELAVGTNAIAVLLEGGLVEVYRLVDGGRASAPVFDKHVPTARSIAWTGEGELLIVTDNGRELVRY